VVICRTSSGSALSLDAIRLQAFVGDSGTEQGFRYQFRFESGADLGSGGTEASFTPHTKAPRPIRRQLFRARTRITNEIHP
jgi:hypothetical protein